MTIKPVCYIAPAGHGKTEFICDRISTSKGCTLILTHTRAGVSAINQRLRKKGVSGPAYCVSTIAGYCEKWVLSYPAASCFSNEIDKTRHSREYYKELYSAAQVLFSKDWFQSVFQNSYREVIVDEYQDCTFPQHESVLKLAKDVPLIVLGDPMQGIFYWASDEGLVDLMSLDFEFKQLPEDQPWRWICSNNRILGDYIATVRNNLLPTLSGNDVLLNLYSTAGTVDLLTAEELRRWYISSPSETYLYLARWQKGQTSFAASKNGFQVLEPIDSREIKDLITKLTALSGAQLCLAIIDIASICFTGINQELKSYISRLKQDSFDFSRIKKYSSLGELLTALNENSHPSEIKAALDWFKNQSSFRLYRKCLYGEVIRALTVSIEEGVELLEAYEMSHALLASYESRYQLNRLSSRTVLSKGLEYDNVIVEIGQDIDPRDFYVAISRAKKRLYLVTDGKPVRFAGVSNSNTTSAI